MTLEELHRVLSAGEGTKVEYKEAQGGVPKSLYETIVSFSNTDGGTVVLGADDCGSVIGIDEPNAAKFIQEIASQLHNNQVFKPCMYLEPEIVNHEHGTVVVLQVPTSSQLHRYNGGVYWRADDNDQNVTHDQQKISDIIFQKREHFSEGKIYPYLAVTDLDPGLFDKARQIISLTNVNHPWLTMSNQELLASSCLWRKDFRSGEQGLTLAAALIFGTDNTIHNLLPGYKVETLLRRENLDRHDDRLSLRTNLIDTYLHLLDFIKKHLDDRFYSEDGQRKDLRELIFREVVGNLIVHREYSNALATELVIHRGKVTATNPNKALFHAPLDLNRFSPYPKNPQYSQVF